MTRYPESMPAPTRSTAAAPLIVVDQVDKSFGAHHVLRQVSTSFGAGEVAVIVGASGSGKSTLLRAINRLEPHDAPPEEFFNHQSNERIRSFLGLVGAC